MTRNILVNEGIFAGVSSGAAMHGLLQWINKAPSDMANKNILVIFPDSGNRYLDKVYDDRWMSEKGFLVD